MRPLKEQLLIATYMAMPDFEIQRRLKSGQLTPTAEGIARAELERRLTQHGEKPSPEESSKTRTPGESSKWTPFHLFFGFAIIGLLAYILLPQDLFYLVLVLIALPGGGAVIAKAFPPLGFLIGGALIATPLWLGIRISSETRRYDTIESVFVFVSFVVFSGIGIALGSRFIKGATHKGTWSEFKEELKHAWGIETDMSRGKGGMKDATNIEPAGPNMNKACCPSCRGPMARQSFAHRMQGVVELDLCFSCQGIWFDEWESPQIAPGGIIDLFRLIHAHRDDTRQTLRDTLNCPHCDDRLLPARDRVKSGPFNYHRCLQRHGRFTAFAQFMIEKGFVRQLTGHEIKDLQARVGTVVCSSCGAPLDIRQDAACPHCRSPISILDPDAVENALASYSQAEASRVERDPAAQLNALAEVIMAKDKQESTLRRLGMRPSLARPSQIHIKNGTDLISRLFGD